MITGKIELKDHYAVKGGVLKIIAIENPWDVGHEDWSRPAVIVAPGGGYYFVSRREGEIVAADFLARGFQVFVLEYLCVPQGAFYPEQLVELSCAIDYVKKHAKDLHVNADEIFAVGFSAGGHLVADLSCEYEIVSQKTGYPLDAALTAAGLCYPVVNDQKNTFDNLLCGYNDEEKEVLAKWLKINERVGKHTPPTFIWTTVEDNLVPSNNSLDHALALANSGVPYELHVYPLGRHGLSDGSREVNEDSPALRVVSAWVDDMARFFRSYCKEKA